MAFRLDREVGSPARRPLHDGRVRPAGGAGACRRRTPVRGAGTRGDARLRLGGLPFTQYAANAHTNDTFMPGLLVWAFFVLTSDLHRGALSALAGWAKFAALMVAPLWASYPTLHRPRHALLFSLGFLLATVACGWIILLDGNPEHALSRLLRADDLDPGPPSLALLDLGLGPVPRCGPAGSARPAETASGAAGRRRPRRLPGPQAEVAAPTRRSHGGAPDRLRDRRTCCHLLPDSLDCSRGASPRSMSGARPARPRATIGNR